MRKVKIVPGEYYHVYNRGNNKQPVFLDERDWVRFLFSIVFLQSPTGFINIGRQVNYFVKHRVFNISEEEIKEIVKNRYVELVGFTLMPNHFHIMVRELQEGGLSKYMQRVLDAYTKYFNAKYGSSGHLFQGPFQIVHISSDNQLIYLSAYIHRNVREIKEWVDKENNFYFSSYQDCINENRWGGLLKTDIIMKQFSSAEKYKLFVETSGAKDLPKTLDKELLLE